MSKYRVRKSVNNLTDLEKKRYVEGILLLKKEKLSEQAVAALDRAATQKTGVTNSYDWYTLVHKLNTSRYHGKALFLPWHRAFLIFFEAHISQVLGDPSFSLPYWDWQVDAALTDPIRESQVWRDSFMGAGGHAGDPITGPFAEFKCAPPDEGKFLTRNLGAPNTWLPKKTQIDTAMPKTPYDKSPWDGTPDPGSSFFRPSLEAYHGRVHQWVGGKMAVMATSPNDPVFWLHHANVDRLWWLWQNEWPVMKFLPQERQYLPQDAVPIYGANTYMKPWDNTLSMPDGHGPINVAVSDVKNILSFPPGAINWFLDNYIYEDYLKELLKGKFRISRPGTAPIFFVCGGQGQDDDNAYVRPDELGSNSTWQFEPMPNGNYGIKDEMWGKYLTVGSPNEDQCYHKKYDNSRESAYEWKVTCVGYYPGDPRAGSVPCFDFIFESAAVPGCYMSATPNTNDYVHYGVKLPRVFGLFSMP